MRVSDSDQLASGCLCESGDHGGPPMCPGASKAKTQFPRHF